MLFSVSKHSLPKTQGQLMPMTGIIRGVVTRKDMTKSKPLARLKSQDLLKTCGQSLVFPSVIKRKFTLPKWYQHQSMEVK